MVFKLASSAFSDREAIPSRYTCDGANIGPPLAWSDAPAGVKSFALVVSDPDAPAGTWYHWAIYNLPSQAASLPERAKAQALGPGVSEAVNDFGKASYGGPCPPAGHGAHHYRFRLFALNLAALALGSRATARQVEAQAEKNCLAETTLVGTYSR